MQTSAPLPLARTLLFAALATLVLFAAHHVYGAIRYATPWRHHAAFVAAGTSLALFAAFSVYRRRPGTPAGRLAGWVLAGLVLLIPVLVVGAFEGAYNHVLKDMLFLAGAPRSLLLRMFPPPTYELPNDALFEVSGVLQVLPAAFAGGALFRFVRALRTGAGKSERPLHPLMEGR